VKLYNPDNLYTWLCRLLDYVSAVQCSQSASVRALPYIYTAVL